MKQSNNTHIQCVPVCGFPCLCMRVCVCVCVCVWTPCSWTIAWPTASALATTCAVQTPWEQDQCRSFHTGGKRGNNSLRSIRLSALQWFSISGSWVWPKMAWNYKKQKNDPGAQMLSAAQNELRNPFENNRTEWYWKSQKEEEEEEVIY